MTAPPPHQRILIVRPSALGDVCRTVPVLASLRRVFSDARIDWLVQDSFREVIAAHPALTEPIPFPRRRFAAWWRNPAIALEMTRWFSDLRRRRYDLVIDCQGLGRSGLFTRITGARRRVGFRRARELAWLGYNVRTSPAAAPHTVDQMLALLPACGVEPVADMRLYVPPDAEQWWIEQRRDDVPGDRRYAVIAPTARWISKRWPLQRWRDLVGPLRERGFERIVMIGAPGEEEQVCALTGDCADEPILNYVGQTGIGRTMAIIAAADLVIANDSAPLHMAVGFDRPCVGLFGPTDPAIVGPYRRPEAVVRRFTPAGDQTVNYRDAKLGDSLMQLISLDDVLSRVDAVRGSERSTGQSDVSASGAGVRTASP